MVFNKNSKKEYNQKRRIIGIFTNERLVSRKIKFLFDNFPEITQIFDYEINDINKKIPTHLLTFFFTDFDKLRQLKEKPVTLHKKNSVYYTINGLNNYIGQGSSEANKQVEVDFNEIGENVILLQTPEGYSIYDLNIKRRYKRKEDYNDYNKGNEKQD